MAFTPTFMIWIDPDIFPFLPNKATFGHGYMATPTLEAMCREKVPPHLYKVGLMLFTFNIQQILLNDNDIPNIFLSKALNKP